MVSKELKKEIDKLLVRLIILDNDILLSRFPFRFELKFCKHPRANILPKYAERESEEVAEYVKAKIASQPDPRIIYNML